MPIDKAKDESWSGDWICPGQDPSSNRTRIRVASIRVACARHLNAVLHASDVRTWAGQTPQDAATEGGCASPLAPLCRLHLLWLPHLHGCARLCSTSAHEDARLSFSAEPAAIILYICSRSTRACYHCTHLASESVAIVCRVCTS